MTILDPGVGRFIVRRDEGETVTPGGIIRPDDAIEKPMTGTVLAIGPEHITESGDRVPFTVSPAGSPGHPVEVGDRVLFPQQAGIDFKLAGEDYILMEHSDIGGVLREVEASDAPHWCVPETATA